MSSFKSSPGVYTKIPDDNSNQQDFFNGVNLSNIEIPVYKDYLNHLKNEEGKHSRFYIEHERGN